MNAETIFGMRMPLPSSNMPKFGERDRWQIDIDQASYPPGTSFLFLTPIGITIEVERGSNKCRPDTVEWIAL